jgi:hypothetical protein
VFTELLTRRIRGAEDLGFVTKAPVFAVLSALPQVKFADRIRGLIARRGVRRPCRPR